MKLEQFQDVMMVWEFKGAYPEIPYAPGISHEELTAGDSDPVFLTLPIGKVDSFSGNNRFYDEAFVQEIERQTIADRPVGIMGHLSEQDRATSFPEEAIHWVGAQRQGDMLWGKGYVPPGAARDRIRRYKATGKKIATSIDALAKGVYDEALKGYRMVADSMRLNQIDIGPADRVGIPALAAVPHLTREMTGDVKDTPQGNTNMDKLEIINEMTADDARLLPTAVQDAIKATVEPAREISLVTELRSALGVDGDVDLVAQITELKAARDEQRKAVVSGRITELVTAEDGGIKVESARGLVVALVASHNPETVEEVETAYKAVIEMEEVKEFLTASVKNSMGPNHGTPLQNQSGAKKYFNIPKSETK